MKRYAIDKPALLILLLMLVSACGSPGQSLLGSTPQPVKLDEIATDYKSLVKVTEQPHRFSSIYVMLLCRLPTELERQMAESPHGAPSKEATDEEFGHVLLNVYVSAPAEAIFRQLGKDQTPDQFPVGTVIVKEKIAEEDMSLDALGIMIKHESGFNPAGGDWEYAYWEAGKLTRDTSLLQNCQSCHSRQTQTDSVFGLDKYGGEYPYDKAES
ncbi:MAG: cytochrome P460 family protein [Anaerolineae bacterium]|nr:cytochrome P460 family protein [Anaerolineae bacterium]